MISIPIGMENYFCYATLLKKGTTEEAVGTCDDRDPSFLKIYEPKKKYFLPP